MRDTSNKCPFCNQSKEEWKQEILGKLPPMKNLYTTPQERLITQYESGFNDCLAQVRKIIEDEAQVKKLE